MWAWPRVGSRFQSLDGLTLSFVLQSEAVVLFGPVWFCLVLFGSVEFCFVLIGSVWFRLVPFGSAEGVLRFVPGFQLNSDQSCQKVFHIFLPKTDQIRTSGFKFIFFAALSSAGSHGLLEPVPASARGGASPRQLTCPSQVSLQYIHVNFKLTL